MLCLGNAAWNCTTTPMNTTENNVMFCVNEIFALICCDMILIFSNFVPSATDRYILGYVYLTIIYISFGVNIAVLIRVMKKGFRKWKIMRAHKQQIKTDNNVSENFGNLRDPDSEQVRSQNVQRASPPARYNHTGQLLIDPDREVLREEEIPGNLMWISKGKHRQRRKMKNLGFQVGKILPPVLQCSTNQLLVNDSSKQATSDLNKLICAVDTQELQQP